MTDKAELDAIVVGLSERQRIGITSNPSNQSLMGGFLGLKYDAPDLVKPEGVNHPIFGQHYRLTDLGQAVRAHLLKQEAKDDRPL